MGSTLPLRGGGGIYWFVLDWLCLWFEYNLVCSDCSSSLRGKMRVQNFFMYFFFIRAKIHCIPSSLFLDLLVTLSFSSVCSRSSSCYRKKCL